MRTSVLLLVLLGAGCSARTSGGRASAPLFTRPAHVHEPLLTCAQATRAARAALLRLGYSITTVEPAKPNAPGTVVGTRDSGWAPASPESGTLHAATVAITCSDAGAEFDAVTDEGIGTQLTFSQRFAAALKENVNRTPAPPRIANEPAQGVELSVEPRRSSASRADLGLDLPAAGIMPVKVIIINHTARRYRFEARGVELITEQGDRASPLPTAAAAERLAPSGTTAAATLLQQHSAVDAEIPSGGSLSGYLYFTAAAYRRARVVLTDVESDEPEGFAVEF